MTPIAERLRRNVPQSMQTATRWLVHKEKKPHYVTGALRSGRLDSVADVANLAPFESALAALESNKFDGVGFALGDGWQGIDLDKIEANGLADLVPVLPGYVERSPSGQGWHAIGYGLTFHPLGPDGSGLEAYCAKRFFTVTGYEGRGEPVCLAQFVRDHVAPRRRQRVEALAPGLQPVRTTAAAPADWTEIGEALNHIDADPRDNWITVGMALKFQGDATGEVERAFQLWDAWSQRSAKYLQGDTRHKWAGFGQHEKPITIGSLFMLAKAAKADAALKTFTPGLAPGALPVAPAPVAPGEQDAQPLLKPVSVVDVLSNPAPPPAFAWDGYLPRGVVALLGAHGGTGKSTIALMLATATVMGRPLFGIDTSAAPAVFVSLEDGTNIVRHRLACICRAWGVDPCALRGRLHIVDGTENPELFAADSRSAGDVTRAYLEMARLVQTTGAGLVVVDNASDAFGGDEIQRRQVRAFMRALGQVARLTDCAVLLLAHVDKNTSRNKKAEGGEAYSGSTAWHNSARSRLFMSRADDGLLTLDHQKSNLGKRREPIQLVWPEAGLPMVAADGPDYSAMQGRVQGLTDNAAAASLLALLAEFEGRGQYASPATHARNNVHALLRAERAFQRLNLSKDSTARVVSQCQRAGWIASLEYRTKDRKDRERWTVTSAGCAFAGLPAPTAPTAPTSNDRAESAQGSMGGAPSAPTDAGGVGDRARAHVGAGGGNG